jgi:hypothetical protein
MKHIAFAVRLTVLALGGCGSLAPFETVPPVAEGEQRTGLPDNTIQTSTGSKIAVCYNALTAGADALRAVAAQSCSSKEPLPPPERDFDLDHCPLLTPQRAVFTCPGIPEPHSNQE